MWCKVPSVGWGNFLFNLQIQQCAALVSQPGRFLSYCHGSTGLKCVKVVGGNSFRRKRNFYIRMVYISAFCGN